MDINEIQKRLTREKLDGLFITRNNMFLNQDILEEDNNILKLTGFSGSNANLLITKDKSFLLTDGRYELQAKKEVDINKVEVFTEEINFSYKILSHLKNKKCRIGYNPWTIAVEQNVLPNGKYFEYIESEIVKATPCAKEVNVFELDSKNTGMSRAEKIEFITTFLKRNEKNAYLFTDPDSVSWLLNIRSDYIKTSPVIMGYALIDRSGELTLFADNISFDDINIKPFDSLEDDLKKYKNKEISCRYIITPDAIETIAKKHKIKLNDFADICYANKYIKNQNEIESIKNAHIKDGVAVSKFIYWLENNKDDISEIDVAKKLLEFRKEQKGFIHNSFETIVGSGSNGAIVHYHPTTKSNKKIEKNSLLLIDSGGHYFDGTTDITRTFAIGKASKEMKRDYTIVLKSHIALASAIFPNGDINEDLSIPTEGSKLDIIARSVMWKYGKDYAHGTGHGVGFVTNVHEGPSYISKRNGPISAGVITSIEPGFYKENEYGVRLENLYIVRESHLDKMLEFEALTFVPFEKEMIDFSMLNDEEINWIEKYNEQIFEKLSPFLDDITKKWLKNKLS